jgi:HPt (histidine-containing phosphotransfer) domain-containing protein
VIRDEIRARFLGKFLDSARARVCRALDAIARDDARAAWCELHALAGEAAILGLPEISEQARTAGASAKRWMADVSSEREACEGCLRRIELAVAQLDANPSA